MKFTIHQIATMLNGTVEGDGSQQIHTVSKIQEGKAGSIAFLANLKYEEHLYATDASAVIVSKEFSPKKEVSATLIKVDDAYSAFGQLLEQYKKMVSFAKKGIHPKATVEETANVGMNTYIGAGAYIGNQSEIGENCQIYPQVYIGDNVKIGNNTILYPGVKIYDNCIVGNQCTVQANSVIGSDGFGFAPQADGSYKAVPQIGNVILEDQVDIGANCTIDCATMGSTVVKKGAKLDNLIQIAHNVIIGENTVIAAQAGISGSSEIGANSMIGGQVGIVGHIKIAPKTKIAAQSGVAKPISQPDKSWMGSPALELNENLKSFSVFRKLPQMAKEIAELKKEINKLK